MGCGFWQKYEEAAEVRNRESRHAARRKTKKEWESSVTCWAGEALSERGKADWAWENEGVWAARWFVKSGRI